jgi:hypothetical protein
VEFKTPYVLAMGERAPKMFKALCKSGRLEEHLQEKSVEAHRLFAQLTAGARSWRAATRRSRGRGRPRSRCSQP